MDQELDDRLVNEFPLLYAQRSMSVMQSCMGRGFECGNGWFDLLWGLSGVLERRNRYMVSKSLMPVEAAQVKEKFGGLRFYLDVVNDYADGAIAMAEYVADNTCEACGAAGRKRPTGWITVLCDRCYEGRGKK